MKDAPVWLRVIIGIAGAALLGYAAYRLFLQFTGSAEGAVVVAGVLIAWVVVYLIWGRKIAARLRK